MQANRSPNYLQVLDADTLLPLLDAAQFSASKVTQDPAITVVACIIV